MGVGERGGGNRNQTVLLSTLQDLSVEGYLYINKSFISVFKQDTV